MAKRTMMAGRPVMGFMLALAIGGVTSIGAAERVKGLVTAVTNRSLQVRTTKDRESTNVSVDEKTGYLKWITHQPWQADSRMSSSSVAVGSCVDIELRGDNGAAKLVRINADGEGTLYDPCKAIR
jgi:hypothetical protein